MDDEPEQTQEELVAEYKRAVQAAEAAAFMEYARKSFPLFVAKLEAKQARQSARRPARRHRSG